MTDGRRVGLIKNLSSITALRKRKIKRLVIIDEIFRGTNTIERIAAAKSVLSYITANQNFVFVSTHDLELAELLDEDFVVYSFSDSKDAGYWCLITC